MKIRHTFIFLLFWLTVHASISQGLKPCEVDYTSFQQIIRILPYELRTGAEVFLSQSYLMSLEGGEFKGIPSGMLYYQYLRPATKKELRSITEFQNANQQIGKDNSIYNQEPVPSALHFFRPGENFEGDYTPKWEDPLMIVPMGLFPVDARKYERTRFSIKNKTAEYIVFEADGEELIFYPGFPRLETVFVSEDMLFRIDEKKGLCKEFVGRQLHVKNNYNLRYRTHPGGIDRLPDDDVEEFDIEVQDVVVSGDEVLLAYGTKERLYLVIDEFSDFDIFDGICYREEQHEVSTRRVESDALIDTRLSELIQKKSPIAAMVKDEWMMSNLMTRFRLTTDPKTGKESYVYLPLEEESDLPSAYLIPHISPEGELHLQSSYSSKKGIYHTKIMLYIDDQAPIFSSRIATMDSRNSRKYTREGITEKIHFTNPNDWGMAEAIVKNLDLPIVVRFTPGGTFYQDVPLADASKEAIRDAWLFSQLIQNEEFIQSRIRGDKKRN